MLADILTTDTQLRKTVKRLLMEEMREGKYVVDPFYAINSEKKLR